MLAEMLLGDCFLVQTGANGGERGRGVDGVVLGLGWGR
jgi:hypothetical protein